MSYQQEKFTEIAKAIRNKTGTTDPIKPINFATKIVDVYNKGFSDGQAQVGGNTEEAYNQGVADGKQAEYDTFWDIYQNEGDVGTKGDVGKRTDYRYAFAGVGWKDNTYNPKYRIQISGNAERMFTLSRISKKIEFADTSQCTSMDRMFYGAYTPEIGKINMSKVTNGTSSQYAFAQVSTQASKLVSIDEITVSDNTVFHPTTFQNCSTLTEVRFKGTIASSISFGDSNLLTAESVQSIIDALMTITDEVARTITFHQTVRNNLTTAQENLITKPQSEGGKGWTLLPATKT